MLVLGPGGNYVAFLLRESDVRHGWFDFVPFSELGPVFLRLRCNCIHKIAVLGLVKGVIDLPGGFT